MTHKPRAHSVLSASSCERWWNCPGSVAACKTIPNPPNKYMAEGTVAHSLAEQVLRGKVIVNLIGTTVMQEGFEIEITEEMVDHVLEYTSYIIKIHQEAGCPPLILEEKIELKEVHVDLWGSPDCIMVIPFDTVHVFDFKYGAGKRVSAWENKQLMYYALGVMLREDCTKFIIHICQPRVEDGFTKYEGTSDDIFEFHKELQKRAEAALKKNAPLIPGDWCKSTFCPNRVGCSALHGLTNEVIAKDFESLPVVDSMSLSMIQKVLKYEDVIKDWMSKVRDHAKELMVQGEHIPGYKVVQGLGNARWVDEEVVIAEFEDEFGDKLFQKKLISPAQLEKLAGKKRLGPDFRDEYTVRPETGYKIVEESEPGAIIKSIKPEGDFNE